jgi:hypothetical protein
MLSVSQRNTVGVWTLSLASLSFFPSRAGGDDPAKADAVFRSAPRSLTSNSQGDIYQQQPLARASFSPREDPALPLASPSGTVIGSKRESEPIADEPRATLLTRLLGAASYIFCALGFAVYASRSVPADKRDSHILSRVGSFFDRDPAVYPANLYSLRMWAVNNLALAATSIGMGVASGQITLGGAYPAIVFGLSLATIPLAAKYSGKRVSNPYMLACEVLSYFAIATHTVSFVAPSLVNIALGTSAGIGLVGRALSWFPLLAEMVREGIRPSEGKTFPSLKSTMYWTAGTMAAWGSIVVACGTPFTGAATVLAGYLLQNFVFLGISAASYRCWKGKVAAGSCTQNSR